VFLIIKEAFDKTWHSILLHKLSELELSTSLITVITYFLTDRKFKVLVEDELSTPSKIVTGIHHGSVLVPLLYTLYINNGPTAPGTHLAQFADDTCIYATEKHERLHVLCKLQRGLTAVGSSCESCNLKIDEKKTQLIYFSRTPR
jgi:hypothetical protein